MLTAGRAGPLSRWIRNDLRFQANLVDERSQTLQSQPMRTIICLANPAAGRNCTTCSLQTSLAHPSPSLIRLDLDPAKRPRRRAEESPNPNGFIYCMLIWVAMVITHLPMPLPRFFKTMSATFRWRPSSAMSRHFVKAERAAAERTDLLMLFSNLLVVRCHRLGWNCHSCRRNPLLQRGSGLVLAEGTGPAIEISTRARVALITSCTTRRPQRNCQAAHPTTAPSLHDSVLRRLTHGITARVSDVWRADPAAPRTWSATQTLRNVLTTGKATRQKPTLVTFTAKPGGNVHSATLDVLTEAGRVETPLGQAALVLAARIDANQDSGGAIAAMAKQLASTLSAATAGANVVASPVDELRARRAAKRAPA